MDALQSTGTVIIIAVLVIILFFILKTPVKIILKLLLNTVIGFGALFLINYLGGMIGISIAVNWLNAVIVGVLGVPGVALILLLQWLSVI